MIAPALLALLALTAGCARPDPDVREVPSIAAPAPTPQTGDTGPADPPLHPALVEPALAADLDPDPRVLHVALTAAPHTFTAGGRAIDGYAYDGAVPGPTLRAAVGDRLVVDLTNGLPVPTTIHWHGVAAPYAMDGVTWQSDPVEPGEAFTYDFVLNHAGTFWYHPHFDSANQVNLGLYGLLVVDDPAEPAVDRELALVFDDWTEPATDSADTSDATTGADPHGLEAFPPEWAINALVAPEVALRGGEVVRARILNASNTRYLDLAAVHQLAGDQGLLPWLVDQDALVVAPGDRVELEWLVGAEAPALAALPYSVNGGPALGDPVDLLVASVSDPAPPPDPPAWPFDPSPPSVDPGTTDITWVFSGDGGGWLINGERYPDVTVEALTLGQVAVIEVRNLSAAEHPFHLHGHAFELLAIDGVPPDHRTIEDTINVRIRQTVRLRLVADNPGDWMAHCHILPHAHDGMMTVLRVSDAAAR